MNNLANMANMLSQMKNNPAAILGKRFKLPQNLNTPDDIIQYLMNTGQVTQSMYNEANATAQQLKNNPQFQSLFSQR